MRRRTPSRRPLTQLAAWPPTLTRSSSLQQHQASQHEMSLDQLGQLRFAPLRATLVRYCRCCCACDQERDELTMRAAACPLASLFLRQPTARQPRAREGRPRGRRHAAQGRSPGGGGRPAGAAAAGGRVRPPIALALERELRRGRTSLLSSSRRTGALRYTFSTQARRRHRPARGAERRAPAPAAGHPSRSRPGAAPTFTRLAGWPRTGAWASCRIRIGLKPG